MNAGQLISSGWRRRRVATALGAAGITAAFALTGYAIAGTTTVQLTSTGPQPAIATVSVGDTVSFVGADNQNHSIISPGFTSPVIYPGQTYSVTMNTPGKFAYTDTSFGPSKKGQIVVTINGTTTFTASRPSVVYGASVVLSGKSPLPGSRPVTVSTLAGGGHHGGGSKAPWTDIATVQTAADGSFSTVVQPKMSSSYRVTIAPKVSSQSVTVQVTPRLTIAAAPLKLRVGRILRLVARIVPATASTSLELTHVNATKKRAQSLEQKTVPPTGIVVFAWKVTQGRSLLRVVTPKKRGGQFQPGISRTITVTGIPAPTTATQAKKPSTTTGSAKKHHKTKAKKHPKTKAKKPHKTKAKKPHKKKKP